MYPTPKGRVLSTEVLEPTQRREKIGVKEIIAVYENADSNGGGGGGGGGVQDAAVSGAGVQAAAGGDEAATDAAHQAPARTTTAFLVEFDTIFAGWIEVTDIETAPHAEVTFDTGSVPICGSAFNIAAAKLGQTYCGVAEPGMGATPSSSGSASHREEEQGHGHSTATFPEYNMVHKLRVGASGNGSFAPRFSYHEVKYLRVSVTSPTPTGGVGFLRTPTIVGYRVGNIASLPSGGDSVVASDYASPHRQISIRDRADNAANDGGGNGRSIVSHFTSDVDDLNRIYKASIWPVACSGKPPSPRESARGH